jgi:hypothetical protein
LITDASFTNLDLAGASAPKVDPLTTTPPTVSRESDVPLSKRSKLLERAKQLSPDDDEFIDIAAELMELDKAEQ